jgi:hypothetical protein
MPNNITKNIINGLLASDRINPVQTNSPANTSPKWSKYNDEASAYYHKYAQYASNVFDAEIQGLDYNDFYKWTKVKIRSSNVINPSTGENLSIAWQSILILDRKVDFIPIGAYVKFNNATWIVYNPDNIASPTANAIVIRCNETYNTLDYYGNVVRTPMFIAKGTILASSPYYMEYSATIDGYQHIIMQLNDVTENITNNTRIILGKSAFGMYGVSDFPQEFTDDLNSCHILRADLRLQETVESDDLVNHVADGKYFTFKASIGANDTMRVGNTQQLTVDSYIKGVKTESTDEYPITYSWTSSDESVATVDEDGVVTAVGEGYAQITCTLDQNNSVTGVTGIRVLEASGEGYIDFTTPIPDEMKAFETLVINAEYFENGAATGNTVTYELSRADSNSYSYTVNGNELTLKTYSASNEPLVLTASYGDISQSRKIMIIGY